VVSGLSSLPIKRDDDKAVCGANLQHKSSFIKNRSFTLTSTLQPLTNKIVTFKISF
jgi:hypothetical protein